MSSLDGLCSSSPPTFYGYAAERWDFSRRCQCWLFRMLCNTFPFHRSAALLDSCVRGSHLWVSASGTYALGITVKFKPMKVSPAFHLGNRRVSWLWVLSLCHWHIFSIFLVFVSGCVGNWVQGLVMLGKKSTTVLSPVLALNPFFFCAFPPSLPLSPAHPPSLSPSLFKTVLPRMA